MNRKHTRTHQLTLEPLEDRCLLSAGFLDPTFGTRGRVTTDFDSMTIAPRGIALQADGKFVVAGTAYAVGRGEDLAEARYLGDGALTAAVKAAHLVQQTLTVGEVEPLHAEAVSRWQADGIDVSALHDIDIRIIDLGGATLGLASGNTIWLDHNAAGWGWFVDATPWDDSEFITLGDQGEQGRMDLLTVLLHEICHVLGQEHEADGLMAETLTAGIRRTVRGGGDADATRFAADAFFTLLAADEETAAIPPVA